MKDVGKHSNDLNDIVTNNTGAQQFVSLSDPRLSDARAPLPASVTQASLTPKCVTTSNIAPGSIDSTVLGVGTVKSVTGINQVPTSSIAVPNIWIGSGDDYNAITNKNPNTLYFLTS